MKNWKAWIPFIGIYFIRNPSQTGWESLQWIWQTLLLIFAIFGETKAQSFELINQYPFVTTSIKYDSAGNEFVSRQQGSVTKNGDTIRILPVMFRDECGLLDFDFTPNGFVFHLSGKDSTQMILMYDTIAGTLDTVLSVPYKNPFTDNHRGGSVVYGEINGNPTLFASFGEGTIANAAQDLNDYRGKLVIIPQMQDSTWGFGEICLFGLRNPYRFSFRPGTNEGFITDVGSNVAEEVNYFTSDYSFLNLGWPCWENDSLLVDPDDVDSLCGGYAFSFPEYSYSQAQPRAIIGGCFWGGNYYFCDTYSGIGGYLDTLWNFTLLTNDTGDTLYFPLGATTMTVNHLNELIVGTYNGNIYKYIEGPLSIDEEEISPETKYKGIYLTNKRIAWENDLVGQMFIYSIEGRVVYTTDLKDQEYFEYVNLPNGMYIIAVYTDRGLEYSRTFINIR